MLKLLFRNNCCAVLRLGFSKAAGNILKNSIAIRNLPARFALPPILLHSKMSTVSSSNNKPKVFVTRSDYQEAAINLLKER